MKNPFDVIKSRYITEKSNVLGELHTNESNRSVARCKNPKSVFLVDLLANKTEIKAAVEEIYKEKQVKVTSVNTLFIKRKSKRRGKGRKGATSAMKKAIVTFQEGDVIDNV